MIRFVLRGIAIGTALAVVLTVALAFEFVANGRIGALFSIGVFGVLTLTVWILTVLVGPFAVVQLWRLRPSGRRATALLTAFTTVYYASGLVFFRGPGTQVAVVVCMAVISAAASVFLLSGPARVQCGEAARFE
jgi:uncharacterized membrane protein YhaH (DUF805 family)